MSDPSSLTPQSEHLLDLIGLLEFPVTIEAPWTWERTRAEQREEKRRGEDGDIETLKQKQ